MTRIFEFVNWAVHLTKKARRNVDHHVSVLSGKRPPQRNPDRTSVSIGDNLVFADILEEMKAVEFAPSELAQPVSLNEVGEVATLRDWIAETAPDHVKAEFRKVTDVSRPRNHVRSVCSLDSKGLNRLTVEVIRSSSPNECLAVMGEGDYSREQLIEAVREGTVVGRQMVDAVKINGLFIERAIREGKVKLRKEGSAGVHVPDFGF